MAGPILLSSFPGNASTGVTVGSSIVLSFDKTIDTTLFKEYVVMFGADYDHTSGPDSVMWIDKDTGDNPQFLRSPGFKGLVELQYRFEFYDLDTGLDIGPQVFNSAAEELAYGVAGAAHRVYITPAMGHLAADLEYTLHVLGDPDTNQTGIRSRTVYDVLPNIGNISTSGITVGAGGYTGSTAQVVNVEITTSGDIGVAKYKWWLTSEGVGAAVREKLTNRRFRKLRSDLGSVQIRFTGDSFNIGDTFSIQLVPPEYAPASTKIVFTTNDGSYSLPPDSPSIPAVSEPPANTIPPLPGASTDVDYLQVEEMIPSDGAFNVNKKTNQITILFSDVLEASSITQDSVRLFRLPALGWFEGERQPREMGKKLTVSGTSLIIDF